MVRSTPLALQPAIEQQDPHPLDVFFSPNSVAVIGAGESPGSPGRTLMANLIRNPFGGVLYPISTQRVSVLGVRAYSRLDLVPDLIDLALLVTPAPTVPDLLSECAAAGVKGAIVLSGGIGDGSPEGATVEARIRNLLCDSTLRVVGANSMGVVRPVTGLNATFAPAMVPAGNVGFLSQSGALLTALLAREHSEHLGCSAFISVGSMLDVAWAEWLDYLAQDPYTECICIYMEQIGAAREFLTAVRGVAALKPVIVVKSAAGRAESPQEELFKEACRCSGALCVSRLADLFRMAAILPRQQVPRGRGLAIVTNARGPAALAADALTAASGRLASLAPATTAAMAAVLPRWDRRNPIDIDDDGTITRFHQAIGIAAHDPNTDALLVLLAPHAAIDPLEAAQRLREVARRADKPILAVWMWSAASAQSLTVLREAGIPTFHSPEAAVRAFHYMWLHGESRAFLAEFHSLQKRDHAEPLHKAKTRATTHRSEEDDSIAIALHGGRTELTAAESTKLLQAHGILVQETRTAEDEAEAVAAADDLGYPVLLELAAVASSFEPQTEGVRVKVHDAAGVRRAMQMIQYVRQNCLPASPDRVVLRSVAHQGGLSLTASTTLHPELGVLIRLEDGHVGEGGRRACSALAPLTPLTARAMIEQHPRLAEAIRQEQPLDLDALVEFLLNLSDLVVEQAGIRQVVVGSLLVREHGIQVRDVRVLLRSA
jgi:acetyltransferase